MGAILPLFLSNKQVFAYDKLRPGKNIIHQDEKKVNSVRNRLLLCFLLSLLISISTSAIAAITNTFQPFTIAKDYTLTGYVDGSYNYLLRSNQFISNRDNRVFDLEPNGLTLQQAAITIANQPQYGLGGLLNLVAGRDANKLASYGLSNCIDFTVPQAYLQYNAQSTNLMIGQLKALAGIESYEPTKDANFSRSIVDGYAQPGLVLGGRLTQNLFNKTLILTAGITNGWNNVCDMSRRATFEVGANYIPNTLFSCSVYVYNGQERARSHISIGPTGIRNLVDLIAIVHVTPQLTLATNGDYGSQNTANLPNGVLGKAVWQGVAGYINYKFNNEWRTSLRGEVFDDTNGFRTGVRQNWREITLTLGYAPMKIKNLEVRTETRHDFSNVSSFVNANGIGSNKNQQSFAVEGLYRF